MWYNEGMNEAKEEIKARLPIEDVVSQYIELKRAGRNLQGHSPWGVDRTPSFMVSPEKGIWHDFSANKGGDIFSFVMEVEGIGFREALEKLAAQAGVDISRYSGGDPQVAKRKARAREALKEATRYYYWCLTKAPKIQEYVFYKRNINQGTVENFRIGYAPETGVACKNFLKSRGFTELEMKTAGLLNQYGKDMFRGRMMIPFIDGTGNVIGYTARVIGKEDPSKGAPKYLNTQDTLLFNKSRFIFGYFQAKEAIRRDGFVVIVEGNMDVISSHQAGVRQTVATSGTAMTMEHLKMLSGLTKDIRLAYDGDEAGVRATERAIKMAGELGLDLSVISDYKGAKDPDELIQRDPELWKQAVQDRVPAVEWVLSKYEEKLNLKTGEGKRKYSDVALEVLKNVTDEIERKSYLQIVAKKLGVDVEDLLAKGERLEKKLAEKTQRKFLKKPKTQVEEPTELVKLRDELRAVVMFGGIPEQGIDIEIPEEEDKRAQLKALFELKHAELNGDERAEVLVREAQELNRKILKMERDVELAGLYRELEEAEGDEERQNEILEKIQEIKR